MSDYGGGADLSTNIGSIGNLASIYQNGEKTQVEGVATQRNTQILERSTQEDEV